MRKIKYRQRHKTDPAKYHFWGVIDEKFVKPLLYEDFGYRDMPWVPPEESEQFTDKLDKAGTEIYDGDRVKAIDDIDGEVEEDKGTVMWNESISAYSITLDATLEIDKESYKEQRWLNYYDSKDLKIIPWEHK